MRLYLSSYQLGAHPEVLAWLVRGNQCGWVVANALDGLDEDRRQTDTEHRLRHSLPLGCTLSIWTFATTTPEASAKCSVPLVSSGSVEATSSRCGWRSRGRD